jgi:NAD-dependent SIR2 family protein deacetylase
MSTAIFLGAGASAAEGAPIQSAIFSNFFKSIKNPPKSSSNLKRLNDVLTGFFKSAFNVDIKPAKLNAAVFPTFEEALGILDLSESRSESLRGFTEDFSSSEKGIATGNQIRLVRLYLTLAMVKSISDELQEKALEFNVPHKRLIHNLKKQNLLKDTIFISTNYDLLIDSALIDVLPAPALVDYGVEFVNASEYAHGWERSKKNAVSLFKIHGSLNWLYCSTCNNLKLFDYKVVLNLINNPKAAACAYCKSIMSPMIVPPTFYKDMTQVFLSTIWNKTENTLRDVRHIIFCGYSLPDADMHIKYLLKRAQTNRPDFKSLRFTVINHHQDKSEAQARAEEERFKRFFGKVNYTDKSFDDFAQSPKSFYNLPGHLKASAKSKAGVAPTAPPKP